MTQLGYPEVFRGYDLLIDDPVQLYEDGSSRASVRDHLGAPQHNAAAAA